MNERLEMKYLIEVAKRETVIAKGLNSDRDSVLLPIDIVLQIIEQAEHVYELEDINDTLSHSIDDVSGASGYMIKKLKQENKRYREAINNINEKASLFGVNEQVYEAIQDATEALEESE